MSKGNVCCVFEMSFSSQMKGYPLVKGDFIQTVYQRKKTMTLFWHCLHICIFFDLFLLICNLKLVLVINSRHNLYLHHFTNTTC